MSNEYDFSDLCKDLIRKLPSNLHATNGGKDFLWIATKEYDIGALPVHYEIRIEKENVYSEIHCEGNVIITSSKRKLQPLSQKFTAFCQTKMYTRVPNNVPSNLWYLKNNSGVPFSEDCVDDVLADLRSLVRNSRKDLQNLLALYF